MAYARFSSLGVALLSFACGAQEPPARPNFVFLLADDLGWRDLGSYGSSFYETPNLDRLAASGMRFTQGYATCQVCSPTRASILSGKYPARMNTTDYFGGGRKGKLLPAEYVPRLPLEEVTIAEALKEAGYATFFAGKWHLGGDGFSPEDQGFDVNRGGFAAGMPRKGYFSPYANPKLPDGPVGENLTDRLTEEALAFMREQSARPEPFLVYLSYYVVHTPLQTKKKLEAKYTEKAAALAPVEPRFLPEGNREARQVQDHAVYAGMVETLDTSVGRVLAELETLGIADETIVIFMSDNGGLSTSEGSPTSNVPLRAGKGWMYEGGIREPLIVRWPGAGSTGTCDVPVTATDFYPTMLEMAGLALRPEQHVDGTSFAALVRGTTEHERAPLFWHYPHYGNQGGSPSGAIRDGDLKLIEWFEDGRVELYDLAADLGETHDLARERPADAERLRAALHAWRSAVDARMPRPNPEYEDSGD